MRDLAAPTLTGSRAYDEAWSPAQLDYHAFTWLPERSLFATPMESWTAPGIARTCA